MQDIERWLRARGREPPDRGPVACWKEAWVDTGVCRLTGDAVTAPLLPPTPPGVLGPTGALFAPTPELDTQAPHAQNPPAALYIHIAVRALGRDLPEPCVAWGYTVQRLDPTASRVLGDGMGVLPKAATAADRDMRLSEAQLTALTEAMRRVVGAAWAPPGSGTAVVVTAGELELKLTAGTWCPDAHGADGGRRAWATRARGAYSAFDTLRTGRPVYMRPRIPGVWHARTAALTYYAPTRPDGSRLPGLLSWRRPDPSDADAGEHGWGRCPICLEDYPDRIPLPNPHGGNQQPADGSPRAPGVFTCRHVVCYSCANQPAVDACPLCRAAR